MDPRAPHVRRARPADLPEIMAIERECFVEPWEEELFVQTLEWTPFSFFVAMADGKVQGFVVGCMENTGSASYGHISNLGVTAAYRRRGLGRLLVARLERQFIVEGAEGALLEVRVSNTEAQGFYCRLGYRDAFLLSGYYSNGEDALVMMKDIPY
ncbi:MAG TPA: ribosomal protein S18-alanine N-acetyltransferase [Methanomicrobiales archaeon]|nr:ribosomal protein S18-alanine N-acetyltransferase [Methanomicrobiales archaeon]